MQRLPTLSQRWRLPNPGFAPGNKQPIHFPTRSYLGMALRSSIIRILAYFDLFDYPLSAREIHFFLDKEVPEGELRDELEALVREKYLFLPGDFYSLQDNPHLAERRIKGNRHADELLLIAARVSR